MGKRKHIDTYDATATGGHDDDDDDYDVCLK